MTESNPSTSTPSNSVAILVVAWLAVVLPLAWGVEQTIRKAMALFS